MGNMYKAQRFHNQQQQHMMINRSTFLPALCSMTSIKDAVIIPTRWPEEACRSGSESSESFYSGDPISPKVGCTGQLVKRNNRVVSNYKLQNISKAAIKYSKLKKLFSGKNLMASAAALLSPAATPDACAWPRRPRVCARRPESGGSCGGGQILLNIREMDPPLPVVKKVRKPEEAVGEGECLWKRRLGGAAALKSLELKQIHHPRHHLRIDTVC